MKILVVGNGGREHALLWKLCQDAPQAHFFITQGNSGTDSLATAIPLSPTDVAGLASWADGQDIDLTVVGPEGPLDAGICDAFRNRGLAVFGPTRQATAIEASKAYSKRLMQKAGVPTADFAVFTDPDRAEAHVKEHGAPIVIKASGLAAGKGAIVCHDKQEALAALREMLRHDAFGAAGRQVVIEEFMEGEEASVFGLTDGEDVLLMLPAQDYKRIGIGDSGPNTGGMGAYAPVSLVDDELLEQIREQVFLPVLDAMRMDDNPYQGLLYAGLMLSPAGIKVVEFNARFGDPETQALLPLLSSSLLDPLLAIASGSRVEGELEWRSAHALTTVLASEGYPGQSPPGRPIRIPEPEAEVGEVYVFHAGARRDADKLVTAGGRVLAVTGVGDTLPEAAGASRTMAEMIDFQGKQYRPDIGWRELERVRA